MPDISPSETISMPQSFREEIPHWPHRPDSFVTTFSFPVPQTFYCLSDPLTLILDFGSPPPHVLFSSRSQRLGLASNLPPLSKASGLCFFSSGLRGFPFPPNAFLTLSGPFRPFGMFHAIAGVSCLLSKMVLMAFFADLLVRDGAIPYQRLRYPLSSDSIYRCIPADRDFSPKFFLPVPYPVLEEPSD